MSIFDNNTVESKEFQEKMERKTSNLLLDAVCDDSLYGNDIEVGNVVVCSSSYRRQCFLGIVRAIKGNKCMVQLSPMHDDDHPSDTDNVELACGWFLTKNLLKIYNNSLEGCDKFHLL